MKKKAKVALIGSAGIPARYGGFETLAHQLVKKLNQDFDWTVYCSSKLYPKSNRPNTWNNARLVYVPLNANGYQSVLYDILSIIHALFFADTLVILGVSGGIIVPFVKWFTRKRIIINIDGLEWRRNKWNKPIRKFLKFSEKLCVKYSHADITDNLEIQRYTAENYGTLSRLIEYGADHVSPGILTDEDYKVFPFARQPYAFKVCRIEPENNIHLILEAFAQIPNRQLVIIGNWNNSSYGQKLVAQYASFSHIHLLPPIYHQATLDKLRSNCHVYLHGHSAGGTNPSLVEAMYLGLPVIAYDVNFNRATTENRALFFKDTEELVKIITCTPLAEYMELRSHMFTIAERRYTWEVISEKYKTLILKLETDSRKHLIKGPLSQFDYNQLREQGLAHLKNPNFLFDE